MRRPTTLAALLFLGLASSAGVGSYTVRPGDTLAAIADRVGSTVDALVKANAIANPNLMALTDGSVNQDIEHLSCKYRVPTYPFVRDLKWKPTVRTKP